LAWVTVLPTHRGALIPFARTYRARGLIGRNLERDQLTATLRAAENRPIELAAGRLRLLSAEDLLARLDQGIDVTGRGAPTRVRS